MSEPTLTFYTSRRCPWAQRAQIVLKELSIPYTEVLIDLSTPRPQWYLDINPRGLVPSLKITYGTDGPSEILTESSTVVQFLSDLYPGKLLPAAIPAVEGEAPEARYNAALIRARAAWFVDTWISKIQPIVFSNLSKDADSQLAVIKDIVAIATKELEPLLENTTADAPFFNGSKSITTVEALLGPFVLRFFAFSGNGIFVKELKEGILGVGKVGVWAEKVVGWPSVVWGFEEGDIVESTKARIAKQKAAAVNGK